MLAIANMQDIGVTVLNTVRHHRKRAVIDNEIFLEGSLSILSQYDSCDIMRRIETENLAIQMLKTVRIEKYLLNLERFYFYRLLPSARVTNYQLKSGHKYTS
jgi:hypothetical protein